MRVCNRAAELTKDIAMHIRQQAGWFFFCISQCQRSFHIRLLERYKSKFILVIPLKMIQKHTLGYLSISTSIRATNAGVVNTQIYKRCFGRMFLFHIHISPQHHSYDDKMYCIPVERITCHNNHLNAKRKFTDYSSSSKSLPMKNNHKNMDNSWGNSRGNHNKATTSNTKKSHTINCTCNIWMSTSWIDKKYE